MWISQVRFHCNDRGARVTKLSENDEATNFGWRVEAKHYLYKELAI